MKIMLVLCAILITAGIIIAAVDDLRQSKEIQKLHFKLLDLEKQVYGLDFVDDFISKEVCAAIMQIERRERNLQACLKCPQCRAECRVGKFKKGVGSDDAEYISRADM